MDGDVPFHPISFISCVETSLPELLLDVERLLEGCANVLHGQHNFAVVLSS